jgi:integrase/recombinase XerC
MDIDGYLFHLKARNLAPSTIKAAGEFLRPFERVNDPLTATKIEIQNYLGVMFDRCKPSTVWTAWRHLKGFYAWLEAEGDIEINPMNGVARPVVPTVEIPVLQSNEIAALLAACRGRAPIDRRDLAIISLMLDTGLRLSEVVRLSLDDVGETQTLRVFGKGRKWRTVALGNLSHQALMRWIRVQGESSGPLWAGTRGPLGATGMRKMIQRRGQQAGLTLHPHMLRHTFVDNWLRNGGSEVDLARLAGWTTTRMAERYAQHRANERAVTAHGSVRPLDSIGS